MIEPKNGNSPRLFVTIICTVIPLICIIACYSAIFLKVRKSRKDLLASVDTIEQLNATSTVTDKIRKSLKESNSQLFRMILVISVCYVILVIPKLVVSFIMHTISSVSEVVSNVDEVVYGLMSANFVVNPFVYFFMNKNYRKAFTQLLPEKLKKSDKPNQNMELKIQNMRQIIN